MRVLGIALVAALVLAGASPVFAADDSRVRDATREVERGARKVGDGSVGQGVKDTAVGIGHTVAESAKYAGEKLRESGEAAGPATRSAWGKVKDGAADFGEGVKRFFGKLFDG